jgi:hypothetical protein
MKKLLVSLMMFVSFTMFATTDSTQVDSLITIENITEAERIIDKYSSNIVDAFNQTVASVTPLAEEGFKMVVKLQIAKGVANLIPIVAFIIFTFLFKKEYKRIETILASDDVPNHMSSRYGPFNESNINVWLLVSMSFAIITAIISIFSTYHGMLYFMAPEWYAIKEILKLVS